MPSQPYGYSRANSRRTPAGIAGAADAVEAVAARDQVALQLLRPALVLERDPGPVGVDVVHGDVAHLEEQRLAGVEPVRIRSFTISVWP